MNAQTERSIENLLDHAFREMLGLLKNRDCQVSWLTGAQMDEMEMSAIMFTVSSSDFKLVMLLHFFPGSALPRSARDYLALSQDDERTYHDYVCELGNNLCGVVCRVLGASGFSTGMSTPIILQNAQSSLHLRRIGADYERHCTARIADGPLFCASAFLSFNPGVEKTIGISISNTAAADESLGELEFF